MDTLWREDCQCEVSRIEYDFRAKVGHLHMPPDQCCDMSGCIALFKGLDAAVHLINTYSGGRADTWYYLDHATEKWCAVKGDRPLWRAP